MKKKLISVLLCALLIAALCVSASAVASGSISASQVKVGDTFTVTVAVSETTVSSMSMLITKSSNLQVVSGQWLISGMIADFDSGNHAGAWAAGASATAVSGNVFQATLKATAPGAASVSIQAQGKNGGSQVFLETVSKNAQVVCATHTYGAWTKADNANHTRSCTACGAPETAAHGWDSGKVTTQPTCTAEGVKTYTCATCSGTKTEALATTAHTYGAWTKADESSHAKTCTCGHKVTEAHKWDAGKVTTQPTCTAEGVKTYTCTGCSGTKTEKVATIAHTWDAGAVTTQPTCTTEGVKTYTCAVCSGTKTEKVATIAHTYGAWAKVDESSHAKTCTCGDKVTEAHGWDSGKVTTQPTCTAEGVKTYTCTGCAATKTEKLDILDHTYTNACDTTCNSCGAARVTTHAYGEKWTADKTHHWHACTVCGEAQEKLAHTETDWIVDKAAQALSAGSRHKECTVCKQVTAKQTIPALGCKHTSGTKPGEAKEPTCTEAGQKAGTLCAVCGTVLAEGEELPATGHDTELKNAQAATCAQAGYTGDEVCKLCGETVAPGDAIPVAEHSYTDGVCAACGDRDPNYVPPTEEPTEAPTESAPAEPAPAESGSAGWIIGGIGLVLLALILLLLRKKKKR